MGMEQDLIALWVTLKLALVTTVLLLLLGTPLAWWLANSRWRFKYWLEAMVALPLVLPPTVLGFYLLLLFSPNNFVGQLWLDATGRPLAFSFTGLVIGSAIYSFPFVVQPIQDAFKAIGKRPLEVAATLGASPRDRFFSVALPLARPGIVTGAVLGFAHTLGEFGVVLMVGGNIPGQTRVASIAIYDHVESLNYGQAHTLAAILLGFSLLLLLFIYRNRARVRLLPH
ncbi:MAG: molybdate ABC transporter permease subunit [Gammaproteobacteria bacterium]|nr:molybdate ABC transporter permease subunit [Gammaproteobacteria bacterium]